MEQETFEIECSFIFRGKFFIKADNLEEAYRKVEEDCAMTMSSGIHTTLDDDEVNWDFPSHPDKNIFKKENFIDDGFGNFYDVLCEVCNEPNEIVRPGKIQCGCG